MKISGAYFKIVSKREYEFSEKFMHPFLTTCMDKIMSTVGRQTDGQAESNKCFT